MNIISVREQPQYTQQIIAYLQQCWNKMVPILYSDCISHCVDALHPLPQWYVLEKDGEFILLPMTLSAEWIYISGSAPYLLTKIIGVITMRKYL